MVKKQIPKLKYLKKTEKNKKIRKISSKKTKITANFSSGIILLKKDFSGINSIKIKYENYQRND
jgi:hypothetical protein